MDSRRVDAQHADSSSSRIRRVSTFFSYLEETWESVQVGRQASYSIERLESLDHYCKTKSMAHVVLVCLSTPLPALAVALMLESLPLQPPAAGWAANWVLWVRWTAISFMLVTNAMFGLRRLVVGLPLTWRRILVISTGAAASLAGFGVMLAIVVGFPVPFMLITSSAPSGLVISSLLVLMLGIAPFRSSSQFRPSLVRFLNFLVAHLTLFAVYPLVKVLYGMVPTQYQGFTMLLLPLWKFAAKKYVGRSIHDMEDYVPGIVAFNVDYFSALFVSVCMYSSGSLIVSMLAIFTDVLFSLLEFREVRKNANILYELLQAQKNWSYNHLSHQQSENLLSLVLEVVRNPGARNIESVAGVRLWACNPHPLPSDRYEALQRLGTLDVYGMTHHDATKYKLSPKPPRSRKHQLRNVSVAPVTNGPAENTLKNSPLEQAFRTSEHGILTSEVAAGTERSKKLIIQGLQLLFHCEYLVLVEYIECVIPIVFVIYKSALQQLPNVVYAPGGADRWHNSAIGSIMIFAVLEVFSFLVLKALLQRKFAFSPLYQLAYVLETQVELVQIDVFVATLVLLPCELEHFGMDFSLRFDWLRSQ